MHVSFIFISFSIQPTNEQVYITKFSFYIQVMLTPTRFGTSIYIILREFQNLYHINLHILLKINLLKLHFRKTLSVVPQNY